MAMSDGFMGGMQSANQAVGGVIQNLTAMQDLGYKQQEREMAMKTSQSNLDMHAVQKDKLSTELSMLKREDEKKQLQQSLMAQQAKLEIAKKNFSEGKFTSEDLKLLNNSLIGSYSGGDPNTDSSKVFSIVQNSMTTGKIEDKDKPQILKAIVGDDASKYKDIQVDKKGTINLIDNSGNIKQAPINAFQAIDFIAGINDYTNKLDAAIKSARLDVDTDFQKEQIVLGKKAKYIDELIKTETNPATQQALKRAVLSGDIGTIDKAIDLYISTLEGRLEKQQVKPLSEEFGKQVDYIYSIYGNRNIDAARKAVGELADKGIVTVKGNKIEIKDFNKKKETLQSYNTSYNDVHNLRESESLKKQTSISGIEENNAKIDASRATIAKANAEIKKMKEKTLSPTDIVAIGKNATELLKVAESEVVKLRSELKDLTLDDEQKKEYKKQLALAESELKTAKEKALMFQEAAVGALPTSGKAKDFATSMADNTKKQQTQPSSEVSSLMQMLQQNQKKP